MAKQIGCIRIIGTIDGICFYRREGEWLARQASSVTRKRFFSDKAFEGSRRSAMLLKEASGMASMLYKFLPKRKKSREIFREIVGKVKLRLKEGENTAAIRKWFFEVYPACKEKFNHKKHSHKNNQCFTSTFSVQKSIIKLPGISKNWEERSHDNYRKKRINLRI